MKKGGLAGARAKTRDELDEKNWIWIYDPSSIYDPAIRGKRERLSLLAASAMEAAPANDHS